MGTVCCGALLFCLAAAALFSGRHRFAGHVLRIGYDQAPPYSIVGPDGKPRGLAVELIQEAAKRQQIQLQWINVSGPEFTGFDLDSLLARGVFDLWPVVGITPERLKRIHITRPWIENSYFLMSRTSEPVDSVAAARGKQITYNSGPLALATARRFFTSSHLVKVNGFDKLLGPVCKGEAAATFAEARTLEAILLNRPPECNQVVLKVAAVPNAVSRAGIGARRAVAAEAEALTDEILTMVSDGTFAREAEKWSSFSASETRSLLALQKATQRELLYHAGLWALLAACVAFACIAWLAYRSRKTAEASRTWETARAEIFRRLAEGAPLTEIRTRLGEMLGQRNPGLRGSVVFGVPDEGVPDQGLRLSVLDSAGLAVGSIVTGAPNALELLQTHRHAIEEVLQLAAIVAEHRMLQEQLIVQAREDRLTGLANRAVFNEVLSSLNGRNTSAALFVFDLDRLKRVNDRFGHAVGDLYIREAARRIRNCIGESHVVARLGGDEFAALVEGSGEDEAGQICQSVVDAFRVPFEIGGFCLAGGISVGASVVTPGSEPSDGLEWGADAALYEAKKNGRNCYRLCSPEIRERAAAASQTGLLIREALDRNWFELVYQPQVTVRGELAGMESLVRIRHPQRGPIAAGEFIEVAEQEGLIGEIDAWALPEAMRQYAKWKDLGLKPPRIAVNVSRLELLHEDFFESTMKSLHAAGVGTDAIQIELTETSIGLGGDVALATLRRLTGAGISLALDDFGCGYSSLSCLHGLPVDTVKIDKSFVQRLFGDTGSNLLVSAIIAAAGALRMQVIAEGVETVQQAEWLRREGCDVLQGYYMSRPLSAPVAEEFLTRRMLLRMPLETPPTHAELTAA